MHPWAQGTIGSKLASYIADGSDPRITVGPYCGKENVEEGDTTSILLCAALIGCSSSSRKTPPYHEQSPVSCIEHRKWIFLNSCALAIT